MTLAAGTLLGRYEIVAPIGAGGMGEVYSATDTRLKRRVAVKVLPADVANDPIRLLRFSAEAEAIAKLNHPNILAIYDVGSEESVHFIVTELLEGESLRDRLRREPVPEREARAITAATARGLAMAHSRGIVHRDIKPENIFLTADGATKILDFGLARSAASAAPDRDSTAFQMTAPGSTLGTVGYASPEQLSGEAVDARTDIFSLGVVMYELLTGEQPFRKESAAATIAAVLTQQPARLEELNDRSPDYTDILRRSLAKPPEERFQSASDLASALESGFGRRDPKARPDRAKSRLLAAAAGIAALIAIVTAIVFINLGDRAFVEKASPRSVAVLPFRPLSPEGTDEYLGLGLADAVITKLSGVSGLSVRPTSAVRRFISGDLDSRDVGKQLGVDSVLDGTFQRAGDRLRVTVNLVRVSDGTSIWADTLDARSNDVFAVQDELSKTLVQKLQVTLRPEEQRGLEKQYTASPAAYDAFLRGSYAFDKRISGGKPVLFEAMNWFGKAIELDPQYALAYAQLAYCQVLMAVFGDGAPTWIESARELLARAERLDPKLALVHVVRSQLLFSTWENYNFDGALRELQIAQQFDPNIGHAELGHIIFHLGLQNQALRELEIARRDDPLSEAVKIEIVAAHFYGGDFAGADRVSRELLGEPDIESLLKLAFLQPDKRTALLDEVSGYLARYPLEADEENAQLPPGFHISRNRALWLAATGHFDEAKREIEDLARRYAYSPLYHHFAHQAACIYALAGDSGGAVDWLEKMINSGLPAYPVIVSDPHLASIRNDPRYLAHIDRLKVRWEGYRARYR